jgi:transcriptional regulator with XRE-family HTH domain
MMTLFGSRVRELRRRKKVTATSMAKALGVSSAYLSALEHGKRGRPTDGLVHQIQAYFGLIWEEADALRRLSELSSTRVILNTVGLSSKATEFSNRLSEVIHRLDDSQLDSLLAELCDPTENGGPEH